MTLDANRLFMATAIAFAILWTLCSLLVVLLPGQMMTMSGHMIHANFEMLTWTMTWTGFFLGLVIWSLLAGFTVWLVATVYNRLAA